MLVDLVQTTTRDGVRLDGMFQQATKEQAAPDDAICLVHGTGGNFYGSTLFAFLAERFVQMGCSVLRVNTRGHDLISNAATARGGRRLGAAYEVVDDCRHDIRVWLEWLAERGCKRVALIGHSLGAVKCLYALAHEPELPAHCLVAISPPRLSYSWFCESQQKDIFLKTYHAAEAHAENNQANQLMEVAFPLPFVITAAGYIEKYGPDERYNFLNFVSSIEIPLLLTLGSVEVAKNVAFSGTSEALQNLRRPPRQMRVQLIDKADHFYSEVRDELAACVESWLRDVMSSS